VISGLIWFAGVSRWITYTLAFMAIAELFVFAHASVTTFDMSFVEAPKMKAFLDQRPGDYRIFDQRIPNVAIWLGKDDVWGYAPLTLKRYTEFMAFTQGQPVNGADQYVEFSRFHPLYAMLRWRYAFLANKDGDRIVTGAAVMPHLQLVQQYRVISGRDQILQAMDSPSFNPTQQVILETEPNPAPQPFAEKGAVTLINSSANQLIVEADLPHPGILLITDAYSDGWRARPLDGSVQRSYTVLPANYVLRAIPLAQGHHHFQVEYSPIGFRVGKWISIVSVASFAFLTMVCARKNRLPSPSIPVA
jgi:hypothetical protein